MQSAPFTARRVAVACGSAAAVFVVWLATASQVNAGLAYFYAIPIALAAWWWGRPGGIVAVLACAALYVVGAQIHPVPHFGVALALRLAAFAGVAALVSLARERFAVLEHSAEELEAIRAALAPAALPRLPGVDAAAAFIPSELGVSGDFYLLTSGPDGSVVAVVGDVTGHGPKAAQLATFVRARFAALASSTSDPAELLMLVNAALVDRPGGELVSAACMRLRGKDGHLTWAVAGHPRPLSLPDLKELAPGGDTYLLGADSELVLSNGEVQLGSDAGIVAYTDGATDVRRGGSTLGVDGLSRLLEPLAVLPAGALITRAEAAILEWADSPIRDDLCLLGMRPAAVST